LLSDAFDYVSEAAGRDAKFTREDADQLVESWQHFDPKATMYIHVSDLTTFLERSTQKFRKGKDDVDVFRLVDELKVSKKFLFDF